MPLQNHIGQILRWDRTNGQLYLERGNDRLYQGSWHEMTGGQVQSSGRHLQFKAYRQQIRWTAPNWIDPYVIPLEGDSFHVMNPIKAEEINQNTVLAGGYQAGYNYKVLSPMGDEYVITTAQTWMSPAGKRLIINPAIGGRGQYAYVDAISPGDSTEPEVLPKGFRYATPDESLHRALTATILHDNHEQVREIMDEGIYDENGDRITDEYDGAIWVVQHGSFDVQPFNSAIFSYQGSYGTP